MTKDETHDIISELRLNKTNKAQGNSQMKFARHVLWHNSPLDENDFKKAGFQNDFTQRTTLPEP